MAGQLVNEMKRSSAQAGLEEPVLAHNHAPLTPAQHLASSQAPLGTCNVARQEHVQLLLELNSSTAPQQQAPLQHGHTPYPKVLTNWQQRQCGSQPYDVKLVAGATTPDKWASVSLDYLTCHSNWAAVRRQTSLQTSGQTTVLPICVSHDVLYKTIESLHSGYLHLSHDVEQVLRIADCLQVRYDVHVVAQLCHAHEVSEQHLHRFY